MADGVKENTLTNVTDVNQNDSVRLIGSDNASKKALLSAVSKSVVEEYNGTSLAGSSQTIKSALDALNSNLTSKHKTISLSANASQTIMLDGNIGIIVAARDASYQVFLVNHWYASAISLHAVGNARISISKTANSKDVTITNLMDGNTSVMILS